MKKYFPLLITLISIASCSGPKEPEFLRIENIKTEEKGKFDYQVKADFIMFNPNSIGAKLIKTELEIFANNIKVGVANQRIYSEVPANSEFTIPVDCTFGIKDIMADQGGSLGGLLNAVLEKKIDLKYTGTIRLKVAGVEFDVPVEHEQEVVLK